MGGAVSVSSAVGVGTAFTVVLPLAEEASAGALQPTDEVSSTVAVPRDDAS
jgi:chemotaxis protein histidine kinase CheA